MRRFHTFTKRDALVLVLLATSRSLASPPERATIQGSLGAAARATVDGNYDFVFELYAGPTGGASAWSEAHDGVPVANGVFSLAIGTKAPMTAGVLDSTEDLWLEIPINGEPPLPRQLLAGTPYAILSRTALELACTACITPEAILRSDPNDVFGRVRGKLTRIVQGRAP